MTLKTQKYAVLGAGSFGTVIANIIAENGYTCTLWMRNPDAARETQSSRVNQTYLPDFPIHEGVTIASDLIEIARSADVLIVTVPSYAVREVARKIQPYVKDNAIVISGTKGMELATSELMSEVLEEEIPQCRVGVLSGPNLAKEIAQRQITGSVIAAADPEICELVKAVFGSEYFRVYSNRDRLGVELAGTLKNIYAVLSGVAEARGFGANSKSMMLTRALAEMSRFAAARGADPVSYLGLAGVGDLMATCMSPLSRNFQIGLRIGQGMTLEQATADLQQTAEGVNTTAVIHEQAQKANISMPLASGLYQVLYQQCPLEDMLKALMQRDQTEDVEYSVR